MPKLFDRSIIVDVTSEIEGESNINRATLKVLLAILVELRVQNGRSADEGDVNAKKGAEEALKSLSNFRR